MTKIKYNGNTYNVESGESVLKALLRHGVDAPNACRKGMCQSCLMLAKEGTPTARSQDPLIGSLRERGYFLACLCYPSGDLEIEQPEKKRR